MSFRVKRMPAGARDRLAAPLPERGPERAIELSHRGARRASYYDLRGAAARHARSSAMYAYYLALRGHLARHHGFSERADDDALRLPPYRTRAAFTDWLNEMAGLSDRHDALHEEDEWRT